MNNNIEMAADIQLLLECIQCQLDNPSAVKQALVTIANICNTTVGAKDYMHECGGLKVLISLLTDTTNTEVKEAATYALGCAVENQVYAQKQLSTSSMFSYLYEALGSTTTTRCKQTACFLILCIVANNSVGQALVKRSHCLKMLIHLFKTSLFAEPQTSLYDEDELESEGSLLKLWSSATSAICVAVNNPQSDENQRYCAAVFPHALKFLQLYPERPNIVRSVSSLLGLTVSNNVHNQDRLCKCGGVGALSSVLHRAVNRIGQDSQYMQIALWVTSTLDTIITDNVSTCQKCGELGIIPLLLRLLKREQIDNQPKIQLTVTLAHLLESCPENQVKLVEHGGMAVMIQNLTDSQDPELSNTIKYVLQTCLNTEAQLMRSRLQTPQRHQIAPVMERIRQELGMANLEQSFQKHKAGVQNVGINIPQQSLGIPQHGLEVYQNLDIPHHGTGEIEVSQWAGGVPQEPGLAQQMSTVSSGGVSHIPANHPALQVVPSPYATTVSNSYQPQVIHGPLNSQDDYIRHKIGELEKKLDESISAYKKQELEGEKLDTSSVLGSRRPVQDDDSDVSSSSWPMSSVSTHRPHKEKQSHAHKHMSTAHKQHKHRRHTAPHMTSATPTKTGPGQLAKDKETQKLRDELLKERKLRQRLEKEAQETREALEKREQEEQAAREKAEVLMRELERQHELQQEEDNRLKERVEESKLEHQKLMEEKQQKVQELKALERKLESLISIIKDSQDDGTDDEDPVLDISKSNQNDVKSDKHPIHDTSGDKSDFISTIVDMPEEAKQRPNKIATVSPNVRTPSSPSSQSSQENESAHNVPSTDPHDKRACKAVANVQVEDQQNKSGEIDPLCHNGNELRIPTQILLSHSVAIQTPPDIGFLSALGIKRNGTDNAELMTHNPVVNYEEKSQFFMIKDNFSSHCSSLKEPESDVQRTPKSIIKHCSEDLKSPAFATKSNISATQVYDRDDNDKCVITTEASKIPTPMIRHTPRLSRVHRCSGPSKLDENFAEGFKTPAPVVGHTAQLSAMYKSAYPNQSEDFRTPCLKRSVPSPSMNAVKKAKMANFQNIYTPLKIRSVKPLGRTPQQTPRSGALKHVPSVTPISRRRLQRDSIGNLSVIATSPSISEISTQSTFDMKQRKQNSPAVQTEPDKRKQPITVVDIVEQPEPVARVTADSTQQKSPEAQTDPDRVEHADRVQQWLKHQTAIKQKTVQNRPKTNMTRKSSPEKGDNLSSSDESEEYITCEEYFDDEDDKFSSVSQDVDTKARQRIGNTLCPGCQSSAMIDGPLLNSRTYNIALETSGNTCIIHRCVREEERKLVGKIKQDHLSTVGKKRPLEALSSAYRWWQNRNKARSNKDVYDLTNSSSSSDLDKKDVTPPSSPTSSTSWSLSPEVKSRRPRVPYTQTEEGYIQEGVKKLGKFWNQILCTYEFHPSRTAVDLMDKYRRMMAKETQREGSPMSSWRGHPFSMVEVRRLRRGVRTYGYSWKAILNSHKFAKGRTEEQLRNKWRCLHKAKKS